MSASKPYRIFPLGDSAITLDFGNYIDEDSNASIISLFDSLTKDPLPAIRDLIPAFSSLTVFFDNHALSHLRIPGKKPREWIASQVEQRLDKLVPRKYENRKPIQIPVCYSKEFALDIDEVIDARSLSAEEVIEIHSSATYHVYMLGFLPGFAYMGKLDSRLEMPRKSQPRLKVEPGSVGITNLQTGIYPMVCPGGWQLIGRTPLKLFNADGKDSSISLLHPGDLVQFYPISRDEFESY